MARYGNFDYSHLQGKAPEQVFAETYAKPTYGDPDRWWPERVNRDLIRLFEERETLHVDEAAAVYGCLFAEKKHTPAFTADRCANALQWGVRLGILTETVERGRYVWHMPDRELRWETTPAGWARQIRGLPDGEQADLNRKRAAQAKAAATRQRKAALAITPRIEKAVADLLSDRPDHIVPDHPGWREAMPNAPLPCPLIEIRPMLLEAHHSMDPRRQKQWLAQLQATAFVARTSRHLGPDRRPGERAASWPLDPVPAKARVPDEDLSEEDAAALEGL